MGHLQSGVVWAILGAVVCVANFAVCQPRINRTPSNGGLASGGVFPTSRTRRESSIAETIRAGVAEARTTPKGTPTGCVTFLTGSTIFTTVKLNSSGVATVTASTASYPAGTYPVVAKYTGDTSDGNSTAAAVNVTLK